MWEISWVFMWPLLLVMCHVCVMLYSGPMACPESSVVTIRRYSKCFIKSSVKLLFRQSSIFQSTVSLTLLCSSLVFCVAVFLLRESCWYYYLLCWLFLYRIFWSFFWCNKSLCQNMCMKSTFIGFSVWNQLLIFLLLKVSIKCKGI